MKPLDRLARGLRGKKAVLVLPEGAEDRVLRAARILRDRGLARIVLLGSPQHIEAAAGNARVSLEDMTVLDPAGSEHLDAFAEQCLEQRPKTALKLARRIVSRPLFFGGSMVRAGQADAMLAGVSSTTARVIEASLMTIGLAEGIRAPSSSFLMLLGEREQALIYADCALNVDPDRETLADIAIASAETAKALLDEEPRVAFLSFSTKGSGEHALARKMREAAELAAERAPDICIEGELQADAALVDRVANLKLRDAGPVAGRANVLIFPDLNAGNIAYKLTQHLAGARALGPLLQGFARPVSDLSRGASVEDIVATAIVTMASAVID
ncbi:MAG: phosphate acetyltransferase [Woeseia sp.]